MQAEDQRADVHVYRARKGRVTKWVVHCSCGYRSPKLANKVKANEDAYSHGRFSHMGDARVISPVA